MSSSFFNKHKEESEGWKSHHGGINKINFQEEKELRDNYAALGCITVLTSNQVIGTLTHLDTSDIINVDTFVLFLDLELGDDKKNSRIILAGGSGLKQSQELYKALERSLIEHEYQIIGVYIDKNVKPNPKIAILKKDEVLIKEFIQIKVKDQITEISFKDGSKKVYLIDHELPEFVQNKNKINFSGK